MVASFGLFLFVVILAGVQSQQNVPYTKDVRYAKILRYESNVGDKGYNFRYDTDDPIIREEVGTWAPRGKSDGTGGEFGVNQVSGQASYNLKDGTPFYIFYQADENGYRPQVFIGESAVRSGKSLQPENVRRPIPVQPSPQPEVIRLSQPTQARPQLVPLGLQVESKPANN